MAEDNDLSVMPFYDISTYELISDLFFKTETVRNDIYQNTTFYNSIISSSNNDILRQLNFSYSTDREFNNLVHDVNGKIELSLFHMNIRSLNKNHRGLSYFMQLIDIDFDVIVLSEIWNYNLEFYSNIFKNYNFHYVVPEGSKIGGVGIFIKHEFSSNILDDYKFTSTNNVESLWLEISKKQ